MQNTSIFTKKWHSKFGVFTNNSYLCNRNAKTRQNTTQEKRAKKHNIEVNFFNI